MIQDIDNHIQTVKDSLGWAREFRKDSFPTEQFKDYRRRLKKIQAALEGNCSIAAYGESQVGKSYLISSLLSSADEPLVIENQGQKYSFIDDLNPSGGNNAKVESTGIITRFTIRHANSLANNDRIKVLNLSVVDVILMLTDAYYNDIKINPESILPHESIDRELENLAHLWKDRSEEQSVIDEDDIKDINDYIKEVIGSRAVSVYQSKFCKIIAPVIRYVPSDKWVEIFSLLWNRNNDLSRLFTTLINAYRKIDFQQTVYIPFDAVLRSKGTLLKIEWLDSVCGKPHESGDDVTTTDIYDSEGRLLTSGFSKGELSALIAELTFELPQDLAKERKFLLKMDLLDFPGARSREVVHEEQIAEVLPRLLRRGKVAYLFNKYSRSLQISSVLFCHHNDQKGASTVGETIKEWIDNNIGKTPAERAFMLKYTNGIAPLFFIATKFNIDMKRTKNDTPQNRDQLRNHWNRFDTVYPEIIKPSSWLEEFSSADNGELRPFQNFYPLRDFYWSKEGQLFEGYSDRDPKSPEIKVHEDADYPGYLDDLKDSFLSNAFIRKHFADPESAWEGVATLNNDGSKTIIKNLDAISDVLDNARRQKYLVQLKSMKLELIKALEVFHEPDDVQAKNKKVRLIAGDIRRALMDTIASNPATFGRMIDTLMIKPEELRNIAYDIIVCHTDTPKDFSAINFYRATVGIDINDPYEVNIRRLLNYCILDNEDELRDYFKAKGFELDDVVSKETQTLSTIGDVITKHIVDHWVDFLHEKARELIAILPHADEVVFMLINLFDKLNVRKQITDKISRYTEVFAENEQPNAIGDYASLTLNNFVSSVGRNYMSDNEISSIRDKVQDCNLHVDLSPVNWERTRKRQSLIDTLRVFDESAAIVNQGRIDINILRKLPFWNNYQRWENLVIIGLIYSSDISHCDPVANGKIGHLIDLANTLYRN